MAQQPEIVFRHGPCSASVFTTEVEREDGDRFKVSTVYFRRSYRDPAGNWQTSSSLKVNDIPKAVLVLNKAYEYLTSGIGLEGPEDQ